MAHVQYVQLMGELSTEKEPVHLQIYLFISRTALVVLMVAQQLHNQAQQVCLQQ